MRDIDRLFILSLVGFLAFGFPCASPAFATAASPTVQPSQKDAERAGKLKEAVVFGLSVFGLPADKHRFYVGSEMIRHDGTLIAANISAKEEVPRIVDHLLQDGFLERADDISDMPLDQKMKLFGGKMGCALVVSGDDMMLHEAPGWDPKTLRRLDALRKVLDGNAAEAMGTFLAQVAAQRSEWEKTEKALKDNLAGSDLVLLGSVAAVYDYTARDGGMGYDVDIERVLKGEYAAKTIHFKSDENIGYAKYAHGETVLVFLTRRGTTDKFFQTETKTYVAEPKRALPGPGVRVWPLDYFLKLLQTPTEKPATASAMVPWGEAVEGVQVRLRPEKLRWRVGEVPTLTAEVRNQGKTTFGLVKLGQAFDLEVNGKWYVWRGPVSGYLVGRFKPGQQWSIGITLGNHWHTRDGEKPLKVSAGKYTVRVAHTLHPIGGTGKSVRVVSNPAELEVTPVNTKPDVAWGEAANGLQSRLTPETQTVVVAKDVKAEDFGLGGNMKVFVTYELRNVGKKPVTFQPWHTPLEGQIVGNPFTVIGPDGKECLFLGEHLRRFLTPGNFIKIQPGQSLPRHAWLPYDFSKPGRYQVSITTVRHAPPTGGEMSIYYGGDAQKIKQNPDNVWTGTLKSNAVTVNVVPQLLP